MTIHRLLPRSLRWQFILAVTTLAVLIAAGGLTAVYALRVSSSTMQVLAGQRLVHMQEAQDLVQRTLLIESLSHRLAAAKSLAEMRDSYAEIVNQLAVLDRLVAQIAAASDDPAVLELHQASQSFRNTAHVVAELQESKLMVAENPPPGGGWPARPQPGPVREYESELDRQAGAMVASARQQSAHFTSVYRQAAQELVEASRRDERWVMAFLAGSLVLAWLVARRFLGLHVLGRLQQISHNLRRSGGGTNPAGLRADDEIEEMAHAVAQFQEDRRQLAQRTAELVVARDAADAANKAKSLFLANMSHELRTPLNAILGFSSLMSRSPDLPHDQREYLAIINRSGGYLLKLIDDVLDMAKIEAGQGQLDIAPFDLGDMVLDVTEMMRLRAREKGLRLLVDQSSEFPRYIKGDEARLRQILINLVGNAVKFTQQGGVTVRLGVKDNHVPHLLIEIEDTGPGIAPEDQQRIFEPFVQLAESSSARGGSGLGLSISRQFVQLMGGTITLDSAPGIGSRFRIDLPLQLAGAADVGKLAEPGARREVVGLAPGQPNYRILIAEDQIENQVLLSRLMSTIGIEAKVAENGERCVQLFKDWHPHLIWMDRRMPVLDGVEATRRIRQLPGGQDVTIIAVTASAFKEQHEEMAEAGMDDVVAKPYRFDQIYDCLARHLGVKFIYRTETASDQLPPAIKLMPGTTAVLPAPLRTEMREALITLDRERIDQAVRKAAEIDPGLGNALSCLAEEFDYQAILDMLEHAGGQP